MIDVSNWPGVDKTGATDSSVGLQTALDALPATGGKAYFPAGTYLVDTPLVLPCPAHLGAHTMWFFEGEGSTLKSANGNSILGDSIPVGIDALIPRANRKLHFRGLRFQGQSAPGQVGLQLIGSYGSVVEDCAFLQCGTGLDLVFSLMSQVRGCFGFRNTGVTFQARSGTGLVPGATGYNSGSPLTIFSSCRDFALAGQASQFHIFEADGCILENCVTEGGDAQGNGAINAVLFDAGNLTIIKLFGIRNHHHENTSSQAMLRAQNWVGGELSIDGIEAQTPQTLIDTRGCGAGLLTRVRLPYFRPGMYFSSDPAYGEWHFDWPPFDPLLPANWQNGKVPTAIQTDRFWGHSDGPGSPVPMHCSPSQIYLRARTLFMDGKVATP